MKKVFIALMVGLFAVLGSLSMAMPASAASASTQVSAKPIVDGGASTLITNPGCNTSAELFYSVVNTSGTSFCFANAGTMSVLIENVKTLCPGNNTGQVEYVLYSNLNVRYLSTLRGPGGYGVCYNFDSPVRVTKVIIK